jgi:BirA family biotin operon repressor/biotin-[acetyl-CoA-carboxylase] ligase
VAVTDAVRAAGGPPCSLKWPNDVLVGDRKVAGLLAERVDGPAGAAVVLGIGLNVSQREEELPVATATSLALEGAQVDRTVLLRELLGALGSRSRAWVSAGGDPAGSGLAEAYRERCVTIGQRVRVHLPAGTSTEGWATGVDAGGSLLVEVGGRSVAVSAGDVVHVRPAT